jgi:hypothetical protein
MGEGKTTALVMSCFYHTLNNPGAHWVIIRETWQSLKRTTYQEFLNWFEPYVETKQENSSSAVAVWKKPLKGKVWFIPADSPMDSGKLQSLEIAGVGIDEAVPVGMSGGVSETVFDIMLGRRRQKGMNWMACKVVCNNPSPQHWVYRRFIETPIEGFNVFQTDAPENIKNLPPSYYDELKAVWAHRKDLIRRYVQGEYCAVYEGEPAVPTFDVEKHVCEADSMPPLDRSKEVIALWDASMHPALLICQLHNGKLYVYDEFFGTGIGVYELIKAHMSPQYFGLKFRHIGDDTMTRMEQSKAYAADRANCAANVIIKMLGGTFTPGAHYIHTRLEAIQMACYDGDVIVSKNCRYLVEALAGAWSLVETNKKKSHPYSDLGDALSYGCSVVFVNKLIRKANRLASAKQNVYTFKNAATYSR